ncbi:MAG: patatin-like phospholipase family protein [Actinomycetia bacterium]|nr:patatin-like phospholipase family protein [Actinomycetes bacterium]MCH9800084.1 patatin-like phospholipase family protein [Actinomycetes bacterium]
MTLGLVLAGGGSKGAFEVGALDFLTRNNDFLPQVIAGTSVGALVGGPLAQARSSEEFRHLVGVVRSNALSVTDIQSVFGRQPWLDEIDGTPMGEFISDLISVRSRPPLPPDPTGAFDPLALPDPPRKHRTLFTIGNAVGNGASLLRAGRQLRQANSAIMNLNPMEAGFRGEFDGGVAKVDQHRVAASGITLRLTMASLRDGVARYVTQTGDIVTADGITRYEEGGEPGVIEGMCASASVPVVFPPRRIGDDVYVDGGIVQNIPLRAAVSAGAGDVVAILTGPRRTHTDNSDFTQASFLSIFTRSASDITPMELSRTNLDYPLADGAKLTIIEPTADVLGGFEVEQGLIEIDFDYGWLRAAETLSASTSQDQHELAHISDEIIQQRERAWFAEERILTSGPQLNLVGALRRSRQHVVDSVARWRGFGIPEPSGMAEWGARWEHHQQPVPEEYMSVGQP